MSDTQTLKTITALAAKCIRLEARCDALDGVVCMLAMKQGIPRDRIEATIDRLLALRHQRRLEAVEDLSPETAAELDRRPPDTDLGL